MIRLTFNGSDKGIALLRDVASIKRLAELFYMKADIGG